MHSRSCRLDHQGKGMGPMAVRAKVCDMRSGLTGPSHGPVRPVLMRNAIGVTLVACTLLSACAQRGEITVAPEAAKTGKVVDIMMATSREVAPDQTITTRGRSEVLHWGAFAISVPPEREQGTVTFPGRDGPDPNTDFLTVSEQRFTDERAFLRALNARLAQRPRGRREVTVFVHGFNSNFAEGLYRHAQMTHDFGTPGVPVSYAWPSAASVRSYAFDRESALFARDGLEQVLNLLARSNADNIVISGHSMGALLVMETVRQIAIRGSDNVLRKVQSVVLMSPDLDIDVFRRQVAALEPRVLPIYIVTSGRDRALWISGLLRGKTERLGALQDTSRVADLPGVIVIDLSDVQGAGDPLNHFAVATSPEMIAFIGGLDRIGLTTLRDEKRQTNVFEATVNVVAGVSEVVLQPLTGAPQ